MKAREIMTSDPEVVTPDEPLTRAAELMEKLDVGAIPVVEDRPGMRLRGIITDRDIAVRHVAKGHGGDCTVHDHMTSGGLDVVHPDSDVHDVMGRMRHDKLRRIPVIDENHRLVGIVSQADVAVRVGPKEPDRLESVVEHISEPARPRR